MAIFSSLFAISAHSEAGGACMSNQNSFRASLLCSLVCSVSSSFGAYLRNGFKNTGSYVVHPPSVDRFLNHLKVENLLLLLENLRS